MAYSLIEQHSRDLDIFLRDSNKLIHFASAGGLLPIRTINSDEYNDLIIADISRDQSEFEIEINANLLELLNLNQDNLERYLASFIEMAKKGFYTYDKSKLGNFEDQTFHLVAKPLRADMHAQSEKYRFFDKIISTRTDFPFDFQPFDISQYI
jgi:hypothetical protein